MLDRRLDERSATPSMPGRWRASSATPRPTGNAAVTLGACYVFAGRMDGALLEESIAASRDAHLEAEAARGYRMIGSCASVLVEYERARALAQGGIDYAERVELWNHRHYMAAPCTCCGRGASGRREEIARHALADGRGGITTRITALHVLGYVARTRLDGRRVRARRGPGLGEQMNELQRLSPALWGLAETARLRGDDATAVELSQRGLAASAEVDDAAYCIRSS